MVFSQEMTEVLKILWVVFQDKFTRGCLIKKLSGIT